MKMRNDEVTCGRTLESSEWTCECRIPFRVCEFCVRKANKVTHFFSPLDTLDTLSKTPGRVRVHNRFDHNFISLIPSLLKIVERWFPSA
jgi:hypothetical protein